MTREPQFEILGVDTKCGEENEIALDALNKFFHGDLDAAKKCHNDYIGKLKSGDADAEYGNHEWCKVEQNIHDAIASAYPINYTKWSGVSVFF